MMTKHPTVVLYMASRSDIAGGENYLLSLMRHMDRERFRPIVVLPGSGPFEIALAKLGAETEIVRADYGWLKPPLPWYQLLEDGHRRVRRIEEIIREKNVQLVQTTSNKNLEGALAAKLQGVHHLYVSQIEFQPNLPLYERFPINPASFAQLMGDLSSRVVAVSKHVAATLVPPLPADKVRIIHNGFEPELLDQAATSNSESLRQELGLPPDSIVVTALGRIHPDKGYDDLLAVAARVLDQVKTVHFVHAGAQDDKQYGDRLRSLAITDPVEGHFHFLGFREDIPRILAGSDIFILPSRREGHPLVLLEAMAAGRPAIATRCGGVEDTIVDGVTGYLADVGDTDLMTARLLDLVNDPQRRAELALAGQEYVRQNFDVRLTVKASTDLYEEILATPRPYAGSVAVDLFLQCVHELGNLGIHVVDLEERVRQTEHFMRATKGSLPFRLARAVRDALRNFRRSPSL